MDEMKLVLDIRKDAEVLTQCPDDFCEKARQLCGITRMEMMTIYEMLAWNEFKDNEELNQRVVKEFQRKYYTAMKKEIDMLQTDAMRVDMVNRAVRAKIAHYRLIFTQKQ